MSDLDGITASTGQNIILDFQNTFRRRPDPQKRKYVLLSLLLILIVDIPIVLTLAIVYDTHEEIPYISASIDLGDFKPRARKAPVIEVDEVFGNQFVKEKKEASALPANEAGGSIDGESVVDLDVEGSGSGGNAPNIARCAVRNFPAEAKTYVDEALVLMSILVDKNGYVREAKPLYVNFKKNLPPELKDRMKKLFMTAGRASLQGRRCPVWYASGVATGYKLEVPLSYELYN